MKGSSVRSRGPRTPKRSARTTAFWHRTLWVPKPLSTLRSGPRIFEQGHGIILSRVSPTSLPDHGRLFVWLRLSRREESWKAAEILLLRHQLTVVQRPTEDHLGEPGPDSCPDRRVSTVASSRAPSHRLARHRAALASGHRSPGGGLGGRSTSSRAAHPPAARSVAWSFDWPGRTRPGVTGGSTVSSPASAFPSHRRRCGRS